MNPEQTKVEAGGTQNNNRAEIQGVGLFTAMAALAMSTLSVGLWVATMVFAPQIVQSRIQAAVAKAEADSASAAADAAIWKNRVGRIEAKLEAEAAARAKR